MYTSNTREADHCSCDT